MRVLHPDDVARAQHADRRLQLAVVDGVLGAVGDGPQHVGGRQPVDVGADPHAVGARVGGAFDQPQVQPPLGRGLGAVAGGDAPAKLVGGWAAQPRDRPAPPLSLVELAQREVDVLLRGDVDPGEQRGLDVEARLVELLVAVAAADVAPHLLAEVGRHGPEEVRPLPDDDRAGPPAVRLLVGQVAGGDHRAQHLVAPAAGRVQVGQRREARGRPDQPGQQRHLAHVQVADRLVEVGPRARGHAVGAVPQEDLVQVQRQDVALAVPPFQAARQDRLADLALDRPLGRQERLRDLLGDGRAALGDLAGPQVRAQRAGDAAVVDAVVLVKAPVLGCEKSVHQLRRKLRRRGGSRGARSPARPAACRPSRARPSWWPRRRDTWSGSGWAEASRRSRGTRRSRPGPARPARTETRTRRSAAARTRSRRPTG